MDGLFIPKEFYKIKELNTTEKYVLAVYRQEKDENDCCSLTNSQIADELCISTRYVKMIKKHLKDLGYIKTDGINVIYLGIKKHTIKEQ